MVPEPTRQMAETRAATKVCTRVGGHGGSGGHSLGVVDVDVEPAQQSQPCQQLKHEYQQHEQQHQPPRTPQRAPPRRRRRRQHRLFLLYVSFY